MVLCTPDEIDGNYDFQAQKCKEENDAIRKVQDVVQKHHELHLSEKFQSFMKGN